ncbi:MAG: aldo/keto reductase [Gemmataceae bacterium]|nr:aldo/keto reductase [Gemmataceae bacterium]
MESRRLRRLDRVVPRLGLGLAALGRPGYITLGHADDLDRDYDPLSMQRRAHRVLDAAHGMGVGWLDAARSYGDGERFLGSWLAIRGFAPGTFTVASKWGYAYTAGWQVRADRHEVKDHTLPLLRRQLEESRGNLGEHLLVYQIHSATLESGVLDDAGVLAELGWLRSEGLRIGLSVSGAGQAATLRKAMGVEIDGVPLFDTVQATWNLLERSAGDALAEAHASGMGVIVKEGLANGRLTPRGGPSPVLEATAARLGTTLDALALAAVLAQPWADVVLSGAATVEQLRSNAAALAVRWDAEAEAALAGLAEPSAAYWEARSRLAWT